MEAQRPANPPYAVSPPFSPPTSHRSSADLPKPLAMDLDTIRSEQERSTRAASVLSGMSIEDMEAAEALNSLQQSLPHPSAVAAKRDSSQYGTSSPRQSQPQIPPVYIHNTTTFDESQPEPLLRLFTSQYPLAGSLVNGSLSAYKYTQAYIPGAEWTERTIGLPIAGKVAKMSGVEGGLRWYLQPRNSRDGKSDHHPQTPDVEKQSQELLPAYNDGDRSPPYSEQEVRLLEQSRQYQHQPPPNWRHQLIISTSGLGVAMSQESFRSLRFCLGWLRWANGRLGEAIQNLKVLLERYGHETTTSSNGAVGSPMSVASLTTLDTSQTEQQQRQQQAVLAARITALRKDVIDTLKKVVDIVSQYAGGALPENARNLVQRHFTSLPQRFSIANAQQHRSNSNSNGSGSGEGGAGGGGEGSSSANETTASAGTVMVLAQEGLDMMTQVSRVVNDTLVSAESWFERLGRKGGAQGQQGQGMLVGGEGGEKAMEGVQVEQVEHRERSMTEGRERDVDADVKMEM